MPTKEMTERDAKIVQYLNDAYATERRLEIALQAHIAMTPRADYKKRLREHLKETKAHARLVARRIKALGGEAETVSLPVPDAVVKGATGAKAAVQRAAAVVQGPLHAVRGTGQQERMLKNARTEYQDESEEIATYRVIEALAKAVGDKDTAKLARDIGREEKKMADFLADIMDQLAVDVVHDEVPVAEIGAAAAARRPASRPRGTTRGTKSTSSRAKASGSRAKASGSRAKASGSRATASGSRATASGSRAKTTSARSRATTARPASKPASRTNAKPATRSSNSKPATRTKSAGRSTTKRS
jgi:ferritin-like metal-binding protein YciE